MLALALALTACSAKTEDSGPTFSYPLDDLLRFNDVQALGTHNSYHERTPGMDVPEWDYDHPALDVQLRDEGVRQFELDVWWNADNHGFDVYHVPLADQTSNCETLDECLQTMRAWSDANPAHHPLLTLLEVKTEFDADRAAAQLADLDAAVDAVWPAERRVSPADVRGDAATIADAVADHGWPTLGQLRGKAAFVLHTDADYRQVYTQNDTVTGEVLFADAHGDLTIPTAAFSSINDPLDSTSISAALAAGQLVRTRADSDTLEARENDTTNRDAALASGANFVSTDFPVPYEQTGYVVTIPGGTPSRCNPIVAPADCTPEAIEDPAFLGN
jgi:hypothetical protein